MKIDVKIHLLPISKIKIKFILLRKLFNLTGFLLVIQFISAYAYSQDNVTLEAKDALLASIINEIESQTTYSFVYSNDEINPHQKLNIKVVNESINTTLEKLFANTRINYLVKKNLIVLAAKTTTLKQKQIQQNNFTISGVVKDANSGETLIGASISVIGTTKGVITNEYGFYSITLPQKKHKLQFYYMGYEPREIDANLNQNIKIDIELHPSSVKLEEVTVMSDNQTHSKLNTILTGVSNLKSTDIKQLPPLLGEPDITRVLLSLPGVNSVGEGTTGINVRGGNIDQNLVLLDEAPIYNSSHAWGFFSVFNADAIKDLKFYKGGIPARFGGRASAVLEIRQKEGSTKKFKGEGGIGVLFSRLLLEGPIKKDKLSYLVSARRSYFDLFFPLLGDEIKNNKLSFYDLSTKLSWRLNENNKLFVSGYFGADVMKLKFEGEESPDEIKRPDEDIDFRWKNATASLRWNHLFSSKLFMNVSGIYSRYDYSLHSENDAGGGPVNTSGTFTWKSAIENWIFKPDLTFYQNTNTKIRFGINTTWYKFTPASLNSVEEGVNAIKFDVENGLEVAPYVEYEKKWQQFSLNAGIRYSWFGNIGSQSVSIYNPDFPKTIGTKQGTKNNKKGEIIETYVGFEPRFALKFDINDNNALKLGYNRMFQYIHLISNTNAALPFDIWKPSGMHIKPLEVNQLSIGYAFDTPAKEYNLSVEAYYKTFNNIVEYINGSDLFLNENLETQLLPAEGFSYGAEFSLHKVNGKLTGHLNYTYSTTQRKTTSPFPYANINNGQYYPSNYDRPHLINLNTNLKLGKKWSLGMFFTYQTGRPSTQPTGRFIFDDNPYLFYSDRNAYRIPDTHRMDISMTYKSHKENKKWEDSFTFGVYNIYAHDNAFSIFSTFKNNLLKTYKFSVISSPIPFITYNFKF